MKLINTATGEIIADITTNHAMSIDEILSLMDYTIDNEDGELITDQQERTNIYYDNLTIEA